MKVDDIRESFLEFFEKKGHKRIASDSLVPQNDPTLLFTGAGMNQFKDYFLGIKKDYSRAISSQKCIRTGDLDEVGKTAFHHSFFEMLGNFSFGDYFKEESILWAWEYLTQSLKIPAERLRISIHKSDKESLKIWRDKVNIRESWIHKLGDKGNFWPSNAPSDGPDGPCGPCSEIYYDLDPSLKSEDIESPRFAEIWNLVFTQFDREGRNNLIPLKQKNIDTGMGLERLACVLQGKTTNYEIDSFVPINQLIKKLTDANITDQNRRNLYAISDHVRAVTFAIADGVIPSNEGRGYVIRKLIRRALWHAHQIAKAEQIEEPFLFEVVPTVAKVMEAGFPEIEDAVTSIQTALQGEEERFLDTLETGLQILNQKLDNLKSKGLKKLSGEVVFELYDTYGFPEELTSTIAGQQGFEVSRKEFGKLMKQQRERAKQASQISAEIFVSSELDKAAAALPVTEFIGYDALEAESEVLYANEHDGRGIVILDKSPFYPEGGGQVGDRGALKAKGIEAIILDTQSKDGRILHAVDFKKGKVTAGDKVKVSVNKVHREMTMRNHTATHLLHAALRDFLGKQVRQLGSLVSPDKLRFDYSYSKPLTKDQIRELEDRINAEILNNSRITKEVKSMQEAKKEGAIAFFGEKYGSEVRVITVPGFSKELCGGTHCSATGQIGCFVITSDTSVASGARRIEAVTGEGAQNYLRGLKDQIQSLANSMKTTPSELVSRVSRLQDSLKKLEREKKQGQFSAPIDSDKILKGAKSAGVFRFVPFKQKNMEMAQLRKLSDTIRTQAHQTVYLLVSEVDNKLQILLGISSDLKKYSFDVRDLFKEISPALGASGGGRKDMVQAGAQNKGQIDERWNQIVNSSVAFLKQTDIEKTAKS